MRRVSYHQSVFDLLGVQPRESAQARRMVEACERRCGRRLPEAVRQWYLLEGVVDLREDDKEDSHLWYDYSNMDRPEPLGAVLRQLGGEAAGGRPWWAADRLWVLCENQGCCLWYVLLDGSDDPPVFMDLHYDHRQDGTTGLQPPERQADHFSAFVFDWFARFYFEDWTPLSERSPYPHQRSRPEHDKPHLNGLWLYAPEAEAAAPPHIDYLIENMAEVARLEVAPGVTRYDFRDDHGDIRVTTDPYGEEGSVSAWWLHADSQESLYRLASKAWWCGNLPVALRHWSKEARPVMDRLRDADGARGPADTK